MFFSATPPLEGDTGGNEINESWRNKNVLRDQFICIPKCFSLQLPLWRGTQGETKSMKIGGIKMFLEINLFAFQNVFLCNSPFGGGHRGRTFETSIKKTSLLRYFSTSSCFQINKFYL
jgi:hypothetical protein